MSDTQQSRARLSTLQQDLTYSKDFMLPET